MLVMLLDLCDEIGPIGAIDFRKVGDLRLFKMSQEMAIVRQDESWCV
jgi:hypothetical protein